MPSPNSLQSIGPRLPLIITTACALVVTLLIGAAIGQEQFFQIYLLLFGLGAFVAVFSMGSKYWLLIPISFSFNLPAIPFFGRAFELPELLILLCSTVFACRYALNPRNITFFRRSHAAVLLYALWAELIFLLHPVGLMALGSSLGGARFYFKIALALAAFLIIANQNITAQDARWIIRLLLVGSIVTMCINIVQYKFHGPVIPYGDPRAASEEYYTWHQELALPATWFTLWAVSKYKIRDIFSFSRPLILLLFVVCIGFAALSGKRAGFGAVLMAPAIAALLRKEVSHLLLGGLLIAVLVFGLTVGHGTLFKLPLQVQRSLSYLPGKWDWEVRSQFQGGIDPFRKEMRVLAWEDIRQHPVVGQGYKLNPRDIMALAAQGDWNRFTILSLALGSSWHNTWLGIWADFGFPAVIFWAVFWLQTVLTGTWVYRRTSSGEPYRTLALMLLVAFIIDICRSWTSGHSAESAFTTWWMFGVLVSLRQTLKRTPQRVERTLPIQTKAEIAA